MTRDPIYAALYACSATKLGFLNTVRRRPRHWSNLSIPEFPALFQGMGDEVNLETRKGLPARWQLSPKQYLYVHAGEDESVDPSTIITPMLDSLVNEAFPMDPEKGANTLGGLVSHCWIKLIETWEGTLGPIEVAVIHFDILSA